jgi:mannose-1-phosphate guanylyltransferase
MSATQSGSRWALVLAGGEGARLSQFTLERFGERRPKQYCAFLGEGTMLEHTQRRACELVGRQRLVTVIGRGHTRYMSRRQLDACGMLIEQPRNRDTAPGVFLPLTYIVARDPDATVLIFPSDHYINPDGPFISSMDEAARVAQERPSHLVLAAALADRPETEYGWIQSGPPIAEGGEARAVLRFHEKPDADQAAQFLRARFLWNTMNMAVKARTLWALAWRLLPRMMDRFEALKAAIGTRDEEAVLNVIYETMEPLNFSRDILQHAVEKTLALPLSGIEWCDWGNPERIQETLGRHRAPARTRAPSRLGDVIKERQNNSMAAIGQAAAVKA